jgi:hypothetical protein
MMQPGLRYVCLTSYCADGTCCFKQGMLGSETLLVMLCLAPCAVF